MKWLDEIMEHGDESELQFDAKVKKQFDSINRSLQRGLSKKIEADRRRDMNTARLSRTHFFR